jgi:hypothetical protein
MTSGAQVFDGGGLRAGAPLPGILEDANATAVAAETVSSCSSFAEADAAASACYSIPIPSPADAAGVLEARDPARGIGAEGKECCCYE